MSFKLTSGDKVFVNIISPGYDPFEKGIDTMVATVKGFTCYGIHYTDHPTGWHHYNGYSFYGSGYHQDAFVIVLKDQWKLSRALVAEHIRLRQFHRLRILKNRKISWQTN